MNLLMPFRATILAFMMGSEMESRSERKSETEFIMGWTQPQILWVHEVPRSYPGLERPAAVVLWWTSVGSEPASVSAAAAPGAPGPEGPAGEEAAPPEAEAAPVRPPAPGAGPGAAPGAAPEGPGGSGPDEAEGSEKGPETRARTVAAAAGKLELREGRKEEQINHIYPEIFKDLKKSLTQKIKY